MSETTAKLVTLRDKETKFDVLESRNVLAVHDVSDGCVQQRRSS